jgi:diphthamide synthase (EF-2-diphthine--ammonia ligase)
MLLSLYELLAVEVPTVDAVYDESRYGMSRFGDGIGLRVALHGSEPREVEEETSKRRLRDALIARTAIASGALLVHDDHRHMVNIARRLGLDHITWQPFRARLLASSTWQPFGEAA